AVLLVQRAYAPFYGYWTFPGGRMDPGETAQECVARELFEETGLIVGDPVQVLVESVGEGKLKFNLAVFAAHHPRQAPIVSPEISNWDWVPIDEIQSYRTTAHLPEIASACLECLGLSGQEI